MTQEIIKYTGKFRFSDNQVNFGRVFSKAALTDETINRMTELSNLCLPINYDRLTTSYFTDEVVRVGKRTFDLSSQWLGNSYLALIDDGVVAGFSLGNLYNEGNQLKGFGRLVVVEDSFRSLGVGQTLVYLMVKGFLDKGVDEIKGSTSEMNAPLRKIAEKFPVMRSVNLSWVRYSISSRRAEKILVGYEKQHPQVMEIWEQLK